MPIPPDKSVKVSAPAGFVPLNALAFSSDGDDALPVMSTRPLPVAQYQLAATTLPLSETLAASGTVGPFTPDLGRAIWLTLSGKWQGTVTVLRSTDAGATLRPVTLGGRSYASFSANVQEPIGEESVAQATWWLQFEHLDGMLQAEFAQ